MVTHLDGLAGEVILYQELITRWEAIFQTTESAAESQEIKVCVWLKGRMP